MLLFEGFLSLSFWDPQSKSHFSLKQELCLFSSLVCLLRQNAFFLSVIMSEGVLPYHMKEDP